MKKLVYLISLLIIVSEYLFCQLEIIQRQTIPEEHKLYKSFLTLIEEIKTAKFNSENFNEQIYLSQGDDNDKKTEKDNEVYQLSFENRLFSDIEIIPTSAKLNSNKGEASFKIIITTENESIVDSLRMEFVKEANGWILKDNNYNKRFLSFISKNYSPLLTEAITTFTIRESNKTLIPIRFYANPEIWDVNKNVTWSYMERWLFANNSEIDMDYHWYGTEDWPEESATFYLDPYWHRIVYSKYGSEELKAFSIEYYPGAEYPSETWGITIDDWGRIYVSDKRNNCLIRLNYVPSSNILGISNKMEIPGLDGPTDVVYSTGSVYNYEGDDYLLIANKNARNILKTSLNGTLLNTVTRFKTSGNYYDFISPTRVTQIPGTPYIAVIDDMLNYVVIGYVGESNTLICHNVIKFLGNQHPKDVGVNCFGDIFVPDNINQIHKFTFIGNYLCTYTTNAFKFPLRFSRIKDPNYYVFDQSASDRWSPTHGLKRFIPGSDAFSLSYTQASNEHRFLYWLSDRSQVKLEIINSSNQVIKTINHEDLPSWRHTEIVPLNEIPLGDYKFRVKHRPLFDEIYGNYQQGWRYSEIPFSVSLNVNIIGPSSAPRFSTTTFTSITNAQNASYNWEKMPVCCADEDDCGLFSSQGSNPALSVYNSGYHYVLRLTVRDELNRMLVDYHHVTVEYCVGGGGTGCPTLAVETDSLTESGYEDENTVLIASSSNPERDVTDYYLIQSTLTPSEGEIHINIHEPKTEHTWLDQIELIEAEVNVDEFVVVTNVGEVINYNEPVEPFTVMLNDSVDVTETLMLDDVNSLEILQGDALKIELNENGDGNDIIVLDGGQTPIVQKDIMGSVVFTTYGSEQQDLGIFYLRPNKTTIAINLGNLGKGTLKVEFYHNAIINYLTVVSNLNSSDIEYLNLGEADHSESGSVLELVSYEDQHYSEIFPGQEISFVFNEGQHTLPKIYHILKTIGRYETDTTDSFSKFASVDDEIFPKENKLFDNYPNPFNPVTQIKYSIRENGLVVIRLYDLLGREVSVLVNENKQAGTYSFTFDAGNLASGIYFYTLQSGAFVKTKKMVLMK